MQSVSKKLKNITEREGVIQNYIVHYVKGGSQYEQKQSTCKGRRSSDDSNDAGFLICSGSTQQKMAKNTLLQKQRMDLTR